MQHYVFVWRVIFFIIIICSYQKRWIAVVEGNHIRKGFGCETCSWSFSHSSAAFISPSHFVSSSVASALMLKFTSTWRFQIADLTLYAALISAGNKLKFPERTHYFHPVLPVSGRWRIFQITCMIDNKIWSITICKIAPKVEKTEHRCLLMSNQQQEYDENIDIVINYHEYRGSIMDIISIVTPFSW